MLLCPRCKVCEKVLDLKICNSPAKNWTVAKILRFL